MNLWQNPYNREITTILPIITFACLLVAAIGPLATGDESAAEVAGDPLVSAAVESLLQQPNLEAKIRQRATVFGQLVSGAGLYVQAYDGNRLLVRYEFKIQAADKSMALLQINDGDTLWIRHDVDRLQSQAYVDLRKLRASLNRPSSSDQSVMGNQALAVGGVAQLLRAFSENFDFGNAIATQVANIPMWDVTGEWKKEKLVKLLPQLRAQIEAGQPVDLTQLPRHLPTTIRLTLGRDRNFPLFPYRIEYGRLQPAAKVSGKSEDRVIHPLVTMELYEVRRLNSVPRELFKYSPGDQSMEDQTEMYLRHLVEG